MCFRRRHRTPPPGVCVVHGVSRAGQTLASGSARTDNATRKIKNKIKPGRRPFCDWLDSFQTGRRPIAFFYVPIKKHTHTRIGILYRMGVVKKKKKNEPACVTFARAPPIKLSRTGGADFHHRPRGSQYQRVYYRRRHKYVVFYYQPSLHRVNAAAAAGIRIVFFFCLKRVPRSITTENELVFSLPISLHCLDKLAITRTIRRVQ